METLSVVANVSAVVQIADVIVRLGMETAGIYSRFRNTSNDISCLLDKIKLLVIAVGHIRAFKNEHDQSLYAQGDSASLMLHLEVILRACERELVTLRQFASSKKVETTDGWAKQLAKSLTWMVQDQRVSKSCQRIESLKMSLNSVLSLIELHIRCDIVLSLL